jgi:hypothetical protein
MEFFSSVASALGYALVFLAIVAVALLALLFFVVAMFVVIATYHLRRLFFGLPWLRWISLNEVVEKGYSKFWCKCLLPILHQKGLLELRPDINLPESERKSIEGKEFTFHTVHLFNFKLTKRGGGRRPKKWKAVFPAWWHPLPA